MAHYQRQCVNTKVKRATFFEFDKDDKVVDNYVVEGKSNAGGTVEASISGLSAEATKK